MAQALDARSFTHGGEIFMPASHGPLSSGKGRSLLAHELTHVAQQRRLGSSLPNEASSHGRSLEAEAVAAERSPMPLVPGRSGHSAPDHGAAAGGAPTMTGPQRAAGDGLMPESSESTGRTTLELGPVQRAPATAGTQSGAGDAVAAPGPRAYTEPELESLAQQLYARIGRRLRRELLVDRERAGVAMDLR